MAAKKGAAAGDGEEGETGPGGEGWGEEDADLELGLDVEEAAPAERCVYTVSCVRIQAVYVRIWGRGMYVCTPLTHVSSFRVLRFLYL